MYSVPVAPTLILCPLLSYFSDRKENRGWFLLVACLLACACFLWLLLIEVGNHPYVVIVPLFLAQMSYCLFVANMWPALTILLRSTSKETESEEDDTSGRNSLAIGILSGATNVALAITPIIIGHVLDTTLISSDGVESHDYVLAFRNILIAFLSIDSFAAVVFLIWMIVSPRSLNR